jgi:hypothetical protein
MQKLRNQLIAGGAVLLLAAIGTMMNRQAAQAAGGPSVTIESPIPLPVTGTVAVTGSTTVSGTVAATQSGTWNVGLTGTPNVNVANPATAPALFLNVEDPGRVAYQAVAKGGCGPVGSCFAGFSLVPANHRLVIQHISVKGVTGVAPANVLVELHVNLPGIGADDFSATATASPIFVFDQPVLLYVDAGAFALVDVSGAGITSIEVNLAGYMLDCTTGPCAAIAH